ncbi:FadR/GntR family transcriptional regulator [Micromonospora inyonensis]|uniref:DNA-binding transcriptional regulator, FadR family n=1 Tax=Micromonospora inyonensis TaxID=47866 RepID=A0A1C6SDB0_9ACTN|nr:FCD domain-containing protein [Micromonospora inyonensis]SCL27446.1 DNA-binding transcriptional regulator, FadR family [Micromonospora inyonensis]
MAEAPRAWRTVLDHLERELSGGRLGPGDRLPGERDLAARLGVGRSSVREAVRVLDVMGVVRTATGSGPSSGAIIVARPGAGMSTMLRLQTAAQAFGVDDVVATRVAIETAVVETLASSSDEVRSLGPARELLAAMEDDLLTPAEFLALDARFHLTLAEATGNQVMLAVMGGLRTAIEAYVQQGITRIDDWSATVARLRAEHAALLDAVTAGHAELARTCVRDHIHGYFAQLRP